MDKNINKGVHKDNSKIIDFAKKGTADTKKIHKKDPSGNNIYEELFRNINIKEVVDKLNKKGQSDYEIKKQIDKDNLKNIRPAKTTVNYLPHDYVVIIKGIGYAKLLDVVNLESKEIFSKVQFILEIAGYGSAVSPNFNIGDYVDIRSTSNVAPRPMFYNENSISKWVEYFKDKNKELVAAYTTTDKDKRSKRFTSLTLNEAISEGSDEKGIFTGQESVEINEYFITEEHNLYGIYEF